ncbi:MAG: ATP-binding protein [Clostridia bacterium]|nr:ATP-binding protein [Clostridium sp.]
MYRRIMEELIKWKKCKERKPLILRGARQVGKTYIIKQFGEENYDGVAYFNFDHDTQLQNMFETTKDPKSILEQLSFVYGKAILPEKTLIVFDEIQECPNALNSLKYFEEEAKEYHIVSAGSLLGIRLSHTSFPVGKVDFLDMYPMTFTEFLEADGQKNLVNYMDSIKKIENIPDIFFNKLSEKLKAYFIIGGMPEVVDSWTKYKDMEKVNKIQDNILKSYESDFSKHTTNVEANRISIIWNSIPSQISKENKKFLYQVAKNGARAREYEGAVNWLRDANVVNKIYNVTKPSMPLIGYNDLASFKMYLNDVGLLRKKTDLDSKVIIEENKLFQEFKGALTENYVLQTLVANGLKPYYYTFDNKYEIDFIIQYQNEIIPIEVKSGKSVNNTSLKVYNEVNKPKTRIRLSMKNLSKDDNLINIPLFMIEYLKEFIEI